MNKVKCLSFTGKLSVLTGPERSVRACCVKISPLKSLLQSLAEEITHACGFTHTHTVLTYAGKDTAERECGIVEGFGAGGQQLFALFIFDLS